MKTDVISISSQGSHMEEALAQAEKVSAYHGLSPKSVLHLQLLTEETLGLMRAITGSVNGEFWIENEGSQFELHLKVTAFIDEKKREQLLSASTSGVNEAARGFMGKIRAFFELSGDAPSMRGMFLPVSSPHASDAIVWSMDDYRAQLRQYSDQENSPAAQEAWDELEKSVVARLADEVKVRIDGYDVEMTAYKKVL